MPVKCLCSFRFPGKFEELFKKKFGRERKSDNFALVAKILKLPALPPIGAYFDIADIVNSISGVVTKHGFAVDRNGCTHVAVDLDVELDGITSNEDFVQSLKELEDAGWTS